MSHKSKGRKNLRNVSAYPTMREGYHAVEFALRSLAEQAQDLRMGYEVPEDKPERLWIGSGDTGVAS